MSKRYSLLSLLLAGATILSGCGGSDSSTSFGGTVVAPTSNTPQGGQSTTFKVFVPPAGGNVDLPNVNGLTGFMTFAPGATEGTQLTLTLSTTPPPGISGNGFFYLLFNTSKPLELSLLKELRITEAAAVNTRVAAQEVRPRAIAGDAELYNAQLYSYAGGSANYLETLNGNYNQTSSHASFTQPPSRVLDPETPYLFEGNAVQQDTIPVTITNNSGISPAYITIVGQNPLKLPSGKDDPNFYHVTADGKMQAYAGDDRTSYNPLNRQVGWTDRYNIPIGAGNTTLNLPPVFAARMYVTLGRKMQIQINDYIPPPPPALTPVPAPRFLAAQPNLWGTDADDPNYRTLCDWLEFDYKVNVDTNTAGIGINKSDVDQFGFGLQFTLDGVTNGKQRRGTNDGAREAIFSTLQADPNFQKLIIAGPAKGKKEDGSEFDIDLPIRASAPVHAVENLALNRPFPQYPNMAVDYFDQYLTDVYARYLGEQLKCYTSAFGIWYGQTNGNNQLVFTCVDANGAPRAGFDKIYVRKPSTAEAFEPTPLITSGGITYQPVPNGPFVPVPQPQAGDKVPGPGDDPKLFTKFAAGEIISAMSAAMNRTTLLHEPLLTRDYVNHPADRTLFYKKDATTPRINVYAKTIHDNALLSADAPGPPASNGGGAAYAFGFDDNSNQSSFVAEIQKPTGLEVVIPKFTP